MTYYNFPDNRITLLAGLDFGSLPKKIFFENQEFILKDEFHVTIIGNERVARKISPENTQETNIKISKIFQKFVDKNKFESYEVLNELRLVEVSDNKTIVAMVSLPGIDKFYAELNIILGSKIPTQPTHVTLYTLPNDTYGIPISSQKDLSDITRFINIPEVEYILHSLNMNNKIVIL